MSPIPKSLRILLPVATATTAAIITAYLIAQQHNNLKDLKDEDQLLDNVDLETKPFEEELIENKEQSEDTSKEDEGDSKPKAPEEKEAKKSEVEQEKAVIEEAPTDIEQMVSNAVNQVADMMEKAQGLQTVNEMTLKMPDAPQTQAPSKGNKEESKGPKSVSDKPNPEEVGTGNLIPEDKGIMQAETGDSQLGEEEPKSNMVQEIQSLPTQEEGEAGEYQETTIENTTDLSHQEAKVEKEEMAGQQGSENDAIHAPAGEDPSQEAEAYETSGKEEKTRGENFQGDDETGSDNESVNMTEDQIKQLLNWREEMANYRGKLGALLRR